MPAFAAAAIAVAGCGGDDDDAPEKPDDLVAIEAGLLEKLVDGTDVDAGETLPEVVDCPADANLDADPAEFTCEVTGGDAEPGEVEVTIRADGYDYTGQFAEQAFGGTGDGSLAPEGEGEEPIESSSSGAY